MSGSDFVFNISKGSWAYIVNNIGTLGGSIIAVPLKASGLETDETLKDYDTLSALLAGTTDEATDGTTPWARKTLTSLSASPPDDTTGNNKVTGDSADIDFGNVSANGSAIGKVILCYKPSGGTDSNTVPLTAHTEDITPDGSQIVLSVNGFAVAQ